MKNVISVFVAWLSIYPVSAADASHDMICMKTHEKDTIGAIKAISHTKDSRGVIIHMGNPKDARLVVSFDSTNGAKKTYFFSDGILNGWIMKTSTDTSGTN